ncbi:MAG: trypsin-like serine protease, partial [Halobacteriovoraceae bacterium]|nr:trypsin-like serine protease [Halobacteriovoraceae bacterium]
MRIFLFIAFILNPSFLNSQTHENCSEQFISAYEDMEKSFKNIYRPEATKEDLDNLKASMNSFLQKNINISCMLNGDVINPTTEVKAFLSHLKTIPVKFVNKVVYGEDNRVDVDESPKKRYARWAESTAAKIHISDIKPDGSLEGRTLEEKLCKGERFVTQTMVAQCTGFLVGKNILLTAGHCMMFQEDCEKFRWVFGFHKGVDRISPLDIYECSEIISTFQEDLKSINNHDYAVVRLDREVLYRWPLLFR